MAPLDRARPANRVTVSSLPPFTPSFLPNLPWFPGFLLQSWRPVLQGLAKVQRRGNPARLRCMTERKLVFLRRLGSSVTLWVVALWIIFSGYEPGFLGLVGALSLLGMWEF